MLDYKGHIFKRGRECDLTHCQMSNVNDSCLQQNQRKASPEFWHFFQDKGDFILYWKLIWNASYENIARVLTNIIIIILSPAGRVCRCYVSSPIHHTACAPQHSFHHHQVFIFTIIITFSSWSSSSFKHRYISTAIQQTSQNARCANVYQRLS